ncbi:Arm DNA-binding domain-containing protein [Desulfococcus sp.]|uniref:Arm DNA-binding domain-containing protein n=1 Tax=Desulfococcus sp. TaxID=2025834 RepID=UPI0035930337
MTVWKVKSGWYQDQWTYKFTLKGRQYKREGFKTKREALKAEIEHQKKSHESQSGTADKYGILRSL